MSAVKEGKMLNDRCAKYLERVVAVEGEMCCILDKPNHTFWSANNTKARGTACPDEKVVSEE